MKVQSSANTVTHTQMIIWCTLAPAGLPLPGIITCHRTLEGSTCLRNISETLHVGLVLRGMLNLCHTCHWRPGPGKVVWFYSSWMFNHECTSRRASGSAHILNGRCRCLFWLWGYVDGGLKYDVKYVSGIGSALDLNQLVGRNKPSFKSFKKITEVQDRRQFQSFLVNYLYFFKPPWTIRKSHKTHSQCANKLKTSSKTTIFTHP